MKSRVAVTLVISFLLFAHHVAADDTHPNILLIMADDVGCDVLGCYGGESYPTPRLDQLANSGMRFQFCFSMPVCHPTRICLLTGRYPFRHGNPAWGTFPEGAEGQTFAHVLKQAGYATAIAGKWQLTLMRDDPLHPQRLGFDESCLFGWHEGARYYHPLIYQNGKVLAGTEGRYGPDIYTAFLIDFIERHRGGPFVAYYSMALCHDVTDDLEAPVPYGPHGHYDTYAQMVAAMDVRVGRLLDALDRLELSKRTVVIFTTDNGTANRYIHSVDGDQYVRKPVYSMYKGQEVRGGKGELSNGGTHVPLLVRWPSVISPNQVVDDLIDFSDFLPTLADLASAPMPANVQFDGRSFAPRLRGDSQYVPRPWAFAEYRGVSWVRTQRWKYYQDGRLFDLRQDVKELEPIAVNNESSEAAQARRTLREQMSSLRSRG